MVTHHVRYILDTDLARRLHEERESLCLVVSHCIVDIVVSILGNDVSVLVLECELAVAEDVECSPGTCLAASHSAEIKRCICVAEAELLVLSAEISLFACECDDVRCVHAVFRVVEREGADAGLVCMGADVSVRDTACNPYDTLVVRTLSDKVHHPDLLLVRN